MSLAFAVQMKGLGFSLWPSMYSPMAMISCSRSWKTPRRSRFCVRSRKKRSTMLSHEAEVGVKRTWNRLCFQPALHSFMFVGGVVIADQVDFFAGGYRLIDHAQKPQPLLMRCFCWHRP